MFYLEISFIQFLSIKLRCLSVYLSVHLSVFLCLSFLLLCIMLQWGVVLQCTEFRPTGLGFTVYILLCTVYIVRYIVYESLRRIMYSFNLVDHYTHFIAHIIGSAIGNYVKVTAYIAYYVSPVHCTLFRLQLPHVYCTLYSTCKCTLYNVQLKCGKRTDKASGQIGLQTKTLRIVSLDSTWCPKKNIHQYNIS